MLDALPLSVILFSESGKVIHVNSKWVEITGYTLEDLKNSQSQPNQKVVPIDVIFEKTIESIHSDQEYTKFTLKSGETRSLKISARDRFGTDQTFILAILEDITERERHQQQLEASEKRYKTIFTDSFEGKAIIYNDRITECNNAFVHLFGYDSSDEIIGKSSSNFLSTSSLTTLDKFLEDSKNVKNLELDGINQRGEEFRVQISILFIPYKGSQARLLRFNDISYQIVIEDLLEESKARYQALLDAAFESVLIYDVGQSEIIDYNEFSVRKLGYGEDILGMDIYDLSAEDQNLVGPDIFRQQITSAINDNYVQFEWQIRTSNGNVLPSEIRIIKIPSSKKILLRIMIIDISQSKVFERKLREINAQLYRSNTDLEQFAYIASHDLQEPLRVIHGFVELLESDNADKLDEESHYMMSAIKKAAIRMQDLIDDLLKFSRVGRDLELEKIDLNEVIEETKFSLSAMIQDRDVEFEIDDLPTVLGRKTEYIQLFQNLIHNSIKFCHDTPKIQITYHQSDLVHHLTLIDNGIGISKEYQNDIFLLFKRLHTKDQYGGTGIGLAIVQKIINLFNGEISVTQRADGKHGTAFHIYLPFIE